MNALHYLTITTLCLAACDPEAGVGELDCEEGSCDEGGGPVKGDSRIAIKSLQFPLLSLDGEPWDQGPLVDGEEVNPDPYVVLEINDVIEEIIFTVLEDIKGPTTPYNASARFFADEETITLSLAVVDADAILDDEMFTCGVQISELRFGELTTCETDFRDSGGVKWNASVTFEITPGRP